MRILLVEDHAGLGQAVREQLIDDGHAVDWVQRLGHADAGGTAYDLILLDLILPDGHGLDFLRRAHRDPRTGGYAWQLHWADGKGEVGDATNHCYGLAFVLLAYSHAHMAGVEGARPHIEETFALMERHFWEPQHGLYADEASARAAPCGM